MSWVAERYSRIFQVFQVDQATGRSTAVDQTSRPVDQKRLLKGQVLSKETGFEGCKIPSLIGYFCAFFEIFTIPTSRLVGVIGRPEATRWGDRSGL